MAAANPKKSTDVMVTRVPLPAVAKLEQDAKENDRSVAAIIRRIILKHYGLLRGAA